MSELVEDYFFKNFQSDLPMQQQFDHHRLQIFDGLISKIQRANSQGYNLKISNAQRLAGSLTAVAHIKAHSFGYDLMVQISIDLRHKKLQCKTSFLEQEEYILIKSSHKRKLICRKLLKINHQMEAESLKFIQNMENGKIILFTTFEDSENTFNSRDLIWAKVKWSIKKVWEVCGRYSMQILQILDKQRYKNYYLKNGGQQLKRIRKQQTSYAKLLKQIEVSHIDFGFSSRADQSSYPTFQKSKKQEIKLRDFIMNIVNDIFQLKSRKLFLTDSCSLYDIPIKECSYEMQHAQSALYCSYLKTPVPKDPNPGQNKFIFNHIEIEKPDTIKFRQSLCEGGKNQIRVAKLSFYYCQSGKITKDQQLKTSNSLGFVYNQCFKIGNQNKKKQANPVLTKTIAVKVPKNKSTEGEFKYENQKNIIKLFKSGVSAYILKYYVSNQINFQFQEYLLMDFLPNSQPLSNFIQIFKETLSLHSKTYVLVNLANSLRFINDYDIVHMDINLNNVLIYRDYLTKLIDFGQAYSQNLNSSSGLSLKRGYTFPFSSPQYFQRKQNFIIQQDIFSFGIIMYRMIFNDYPFFPTKKIQKTYKNKSYLKKIFLAPQRGEAYGQQQTIDLIYNLFFKCINPIDALRCEPSWLTIFFKIMYFHLL